MTNGLASTVVFFVLFCGYFMQLVQIRRRLRAPSGAGTFASVNDLYAYIGLSLLIPIVVSFAPEQLGDGINAMVRGLRAEAAKAAGGVAAAAATAASAGCNCEPNLTAIATTLHMGTRLLIAYLVTIVTIELSLLAQSRQSSVQNPWGDLLLMNLGLDVISIVVLRLFIIFPPNELDGVAMFAFVVYAIPTVLTGAFVVAATYALFRKTAAR